MSGLELAVAISVYCISLVVTFVVLPVLAGALLVAAVRSMGFAETLGIARRTGDHVPVVHGGGGVDFDTGDGGRRPAHASATPRDIA
jgi:hypothetical protein